MKSNSDYFGVIFGNTLELLKIFVKTRHKVTNMPPRPGTNFGGMKKLRVVKIERPKHGT